MHLRGRGRLYVGLGDLGQGDGSGIMIYPNAGPDVYINSAGVPVAGLPTDLVANWPGSLPSAVVATPAGQLYRLIELPA